MLSCLITLTKNGVEMIKNQDYTLLNKQISNEDMKEFCEIFENNNTPYTCEVQIKNGPRYTYKYNIDEGNPFVKNAFKNEEVCKIKISTEYCELQYGVQSENKIMFEGDENDNAYQYFFTKIESWISKLKKLKRIKTLKDGETFFTMLGTILVLGFTTAYAFISGTVNNNLLSTILSSVFLGICLLIELFIYSSVFKPYEIKIGLCGYKKEQKFFYSFFVVCVAPILIGLLV